MKCKSCGNEVNSGEAFCGGCGEKNEPVPTCQSCGNEVAPDVSFCGSCGAKVTQQEPSVSDVVPEEVPQPMKAPEKAPEEKPQNEKPQQEKTPAKAPSVKVATEKATPEKPEKAEKPKKKKLLPIIIVVALVAVAAIVGVFFYVTRDTDPPPPTEAEIINNFEADIRSFLGNNETIDSIKIVERNTDTENGSDTIQVEVISNDGEVSNTRFFVMQYYLIEFEDEDETRWHLDNISPIRENLWTTIPLAGAADSLFKDALMWIHLNIDGDDWYIDDESLDSVTVSSRNTQLEAGRDSVIVDVTLTSPALAAEGQVELDFEFNVGRGWSSVGHSMVTPFTSEYHPHAILEMTDEQMLNKIIEMRQFVFSSGNTAQDVHLNQEQISNLALVNMTTSNKGTHREYQHRFNLHKELVDFEIDIQSIYNFDALGGWAIQNIQLTPRVTEVRLDGTRWGGIYTHSSNSMEYSHTGLLNTGPRLREFVMEISEQPAIGGIRAELWDLSKPNYQQFLFGRAVDFDDLSLSLSFEEWIVEANWAGSRAISNKQINEASQVTLNGFIRVEDSTIVHTNRGNRFDVIVRQEAAPVADVVDDDAENDDDEDENGEE